MMKLFLSILLIGAAIVAADDTSCVGRCDNPYDAAMPCQCNTACVSHSDCCTDYQTECEGALNSCVGRCTIGYDATLPCQCNSQCEEFVDCCPDYGTECQGGTITDQEILDVSSQIYAADTDRLTVGLDWQGTTTDGGTVDNAPGPFCTGIPAEMYTDPLYAALQSLFDDYVADENVPEDITAADDADIDNFLSLVTATQTMQLTRDFLASKGLVSSDPATFQATLKEIWFGLYERQGTLGSSGAEHVLLGEVQDGNSINGLHNWVRFCTQEQDGHINYLGYVDNEDLGGAWLIRNPFYWDDNYKPVGGFFIETSPAFDLSLYTLCFYSRPNAICNTQLNGHAVPIQTYTLDYSGKTYVGSSYPNF